MSKQHEHSPRVEISSSMQDDLAENAKLEAKMQGAVDRMSQACYNFDLTNFDPQKTEVVHQTAPGKPYSEPTITVNGQKL